MSEERPTELDEALDAMPWHLRSKVLRQLENPGSVSAPCQHHARRGHRVVESTYSQRRYHADQRSRTSVPAWTGWQVAAFVASVLWASLWIMPAFVVLVMFPPASLVMFAIGGVPPLLVLDRINRRQL